MLWFVLHRKCMSVFTLHKVLQRYNSDPKWSNIIKKQYRWSISSYCLWSRDPFTHMKPVVLRGCVVVLVVCVPLVLLIYLFSIYYVCVFFSVVVVVVVVLYCCYCLLCAYNFRIIFRVMLFVDLFVSVVHYCWLWSIDEYICFIVWTSVHL